MKRFISLALSACIAAADFNASLESLDVYEIAASTDESLAAQARNLAQVQFDEWYNNIEWACEAPEDEDCRRNIIENARLVEKHQAEWLSVLNYIKLTIGSTVTNTHTTLTNSWAGAWSCDLVEECCADDGQCCYITSYKYTVS